MATITIELPEEIASPVAEFARRIGVPPQELVLSAPRAHFVAPTTVLRAEMDAWDLAADTDAACFEATERTPAKSGW